MISEKLRIIFAPSVASIEKLKQLISKIENAKSVEEIERIVSRI